MARMTTNRRKRGVCASPQPLLYINRYWQANNSPHGRALLPLPVDCQGTIGLPPVYLHLRVAVVLGQLLPWALSEEAMPPSLNRLPPLSEATQEELWHTQHGTVNQISYADKMRLFDPGDWLRITFDVRSLVAQVRGEMFMKSKIQAGQHLMVVFLRTLRELPYTFGSRFSWYESYSIPPLDSKCVTESLELEAEHHRWDLCISGQLQFTLITISCVSGFLEFSLVQVWFCGCFCGEWYFCGVLSSTVRFWIHQIRVYTYERGRSVGLFNGFSPANVEKIPDDLLRRSFPWARTSDSQLPDSGFVFLKKKDFQWRSHQKHILVGFSMVIY